MMVPEDDWLDTIKDGRLYDNTPEDYRQIRIFLRNHDPSAILDINTLEERWDIFANAMAAIAGDAAEFTVLIGNY